MVMIAGRPVGHGVPCFVVAEAGVNHNGEVALAQRLVDAAAAGVMITLDPVSGDRSQITIESSYGLGLAVVGGEVTPDRFAVDKVTYETRSRSIAEKPFAYRHDGASRAASQEQFAWSLMYRAAAAPSAGVKPALKLASVK